MTDPDDWRPSWAVMCPAGLIAYAGRPDTLRPITLPADERVCRTCLADREPDQDCGRCAA